MAIHPLEVADGRRLRETILTPATFVFLFSLGMTITYVRRRVGASLSLSLILFGALLFIHGIPLMVYLYLTGPDTFIFEKALARVDRGVIIDMVLIAIAVMFACLIVGSEIANAVFPRWRHSAIQQAPARRGNKLRRVVEISSARRVILWLVVLAMLTVSLYESHLGSVFKFYHFSGSQFEQTLLRRQFGGTPFYVYNVALYSIAPFLVMVSYCHDVGTRMRRWPSALTVALFCVVLLGKFGTLSKAPPVMFILQLVLLHALLKSPTLNFRPALKFLLAAFLLFVVITRLTLSELEIGDVLSFLYYRTFDIPNEVLVEYFSAIPASISHSWGQSVFGVLGGASPKNKLETYYAVAEITRDSVLSTSNSMFVGDAWAQFSWVGVVLVSVAAGFLVRLIDLYSRRNGYTDQSACLIAGCSFGIFTILSTSFTTGLITGGLALVPVLSTFFIRRRSAQTIPVSQAGLPTRALPP